MRDWISRSLMSALVFVIWTMGNLSFAVDNEAVNVHQGNHCFVTIDNCHILRIEPILPSVTESICTKEYPCLYDDLPLDAVGIESFVDLGGKLPGKGFTYSFDNTSPDIPSAFERGVIGQAFGLWSNVARVRATEVASGGTDPCVGDVRILFASRFHGDIAPFDGPGGVLAHTFYPPPLNSSCIASDAHFDEDENWVTPTIGGVGIDLLTVAAHEFGHSIGLGHSADPNALMYGFYTGRHAYLSHDDIAGAVAIYKQNWHDVIFQLEMINTVSPGLGSFRIREWQAEISLRQKGTTSFFTRKLPAANTDRGNGRADVDGVIARDDYTSQFDGFWWNKGDLYRTLFKLPDTFTDIDQVSVTLNIKNNSLGESATLRASMNGIVLGNIVVNPGDTTETGTFNVNFVNPKFNSRDLGSNIYNEGKH